MMRAFEAGDRVRSSASRPDLPDAALTVAGTAGSGGSELVLARPSVGGWLPAAAFELVGHGGLWRARAERGRGGR